MDFLRAAVFLGVLVANVQGLLVDDGLQTRQMPMVQYLGNGRCLAIYMRANLIYRL